MDPLTGAFMSAPEILDECRDRRVEEGWDLAVCLTDLPVYSSGRLVVADASAERGGFWRLLLMMVTAIVAMVVWIIVAHHIWERPRDRRRGGGPCPTTALSC